MSLPFLPLKPAGAPVGTAMDDALGQPDMAIIRNILANIRAGDEEGAQEEACRAVDSWLATAKVHSRNLKDWVVPDEELWAKLVRNVFPNAPHPPTTLDPPMTNREWFYDMCQRYRDLREFRERPDVQQLAAFKAAQEASWEKLKKLHDAQFGASSYHQGQPGKASGLASDRYKVWIKAKKRAYRLWKELPVNVRDVQARLKFLERRLTAWDPPSLDADFEQVDKGEFSHRYGREAMERDEGEAFAVKGDPEDDDQFYDQPSFIDPWYPH